MRYRQKSLLTIDFDNTIAATVESSPSGMNVHIASDRAIQAIFGHEGLQFSKGIGGLNNREPAEYVGLIQRGMDGDTRREVVEKLTIIYVEEKLSYLIPEISLEWPRLYPGVKKFFQACAEGLLPVNTGIITSGHDDFIHRVFEIHNIPLPDILVTSDLLRQREMPQRERYKPYTYQFAEAHYQWERLPIKESRYINTHKGDYRGRSHGKPNIANIGDDPIKDGGLAREARVPYIFMPFMKPEYKPNRAMGELYVADFFALSKLLAHHATVLKEGQSFASVLFGKEDTDLFPELREDKRPYSEWLQASTQEYVSTGVRCERGF